MADIQSGLKGGLYCDIISGAKVAGHCTGKTVLVDLLGRVKVALSPFDEDPMIAITSESKL